MSKKIHAIFTIVSTATVLVAVGWGIVLVGSPSTARDQRFDQQRMEDLQTIFREIQFLCRDPDIKDKLKRPLPATLEELAALARHERINLIDPETGKRYHYAVNDETNYELRATFSTQRDSDVDVFWNHPPGQHSFTINVLDPT